MNAVKTIVLFFTIKRKILFNSFKKSDSVATLLTVFLLAIVAYYSIVSSGVFAAVLKQLLHRGSDFFVPAVSLVLFLIFVINILAPLFLGGIQDKKNILNVLLHFPFTLPKIVFFEILSGMGDLLVVCFLPLYVAVFWLVTPVFQWAGFALLLPGLVLFWFMISNLVVLLKTSVNLLLSNRTLKRILFFLYSLILFAIMLSPELPFSEKLMQKSTLLLMSPILAVTPSGIFLSYLQSFATSTPVIHWALTFLSLSVLNVLILAGNLLLATYWRGRRLNLSGASPTARRRSILKRVFNSIRMPPFLKKDIIYIMRSPRMMVNFLLPFLWIFFYWRHPQSKEIVPLSMLLFFSMIGIYASNMFSIEFSGIVNYFMRPVTAPQTLKNKAQVFSIMALFAIFVLLSKLILLDVKYLVFVAALFMLYYFLFLYVGLAVSVYFPFAVGYRAFWGRQVSFPTVAIFLILISISVGLMFVFVPQFNRESFSVVIVASILIIDLILVGLRSMYFTKLGEIFQNRKEKIIETCQ